MALFDTADLLQRVRDLSGRPAVDEALSDALAYRYLTEAQVYWQRQIAAQIPEAAWEAWVKLTSSDSGLTYPMPNHAVTAGATKEPLALQVRAERNGDLLLPGPEWSDETGYVIEMVDADTWALRWPNNAVRTFSDGPYIRAIWLPDVAIAAGVEPTLRPRQARELLVYRALALWASEGSGRRDPQFYYDLELQAWTGRPDDPADVGLLGALKGMHLGGYNASRNVSAPWWRSSDLG